jgi:hypothetical protein
MTGLNHGLTGGLIAYYLPLPIALPAAVASHFLLDMLPHYGIQHNKRNKSYFWKIFFTIDFFATFGLAAYAVYDHHYAMFLGGLLATAPDYIWVGYVVKNGSFDFRKNKSRYMRWHMRIQRYERPWGIWLELPLAIILFYIVMLRLW